MCAGYALVMANALQIPSSRILLLLPECEVYEAPLARQLCRLRPSGGSLHCICLVQSWAGEPRASLRQALILAMLRDCGIEATSEVVLATGWIVVARRAHQPGDQVICLTEHCVPDSTGSDRRLIQLAHFLTVLEMDVLTLHGLVIPPTKPSSRWVGPLRHVVAPMMVMVIAAAVQMLVLYAVADSPGFFARVALGSSAAFELVLLGWLMT